jgi:hypothetical protein
LFHVQNSIQTIKIELSKKLEETYVLEPLILGLMNFDPRKQMERMEHFDRGVISRDEKGRAVLLNGVN